MKTSNITKSALALALGLCASGALAVSQDAAREDFQGDAFANGVNTVATNNLTWADTDQYSYVDSGKLVVDATTNAPTSATLDSDAATSVNGAINATGRTASFEAKVSFTPATDTPDIGGSDLRFALYAKAGSGSTNLVVYTGSETVTATEIAANTETTVKVDFTAANTFQVYIGGNLVAGGPFAFANNGTISKVEFAGNGEVDDLVFSYDLAPVNLSWPTSVSVASYTINGNAGDALTAGAGSATVYGDVGDAIVLTIENADGVTKTFTGTVGTDATIGDSAYAYTWADYLGAAVDGAYEIDNLAELKLFQKGVAVGLATSNETFKLMTDVALDIAWPGIALQNGKDLANGTNETQFVSKEYHVAQYDAGAFKGTFDGQNHTISNFQMVGENLDYCGFFNSIKGATIENLKISYKEGKFATNSSSTSTESGATFVGVAKGSTLRNLTTLATPTNSVSCGKGFGGIVGYHMAGTTVEYCTNNVNLTSAKSNKAGGISMITQNGSGKAIIRNCVNNGTTAGNAKQKGGIVGYIGTATTIENCTVTADSVPTVFSYNTGTVTVSGENKAPASGLPCKDTDGKVKTISGLTFATVDNGVATFVADNALAAGNEYKVFAPGTATYAFAAAGTIAFDTALATPTYAVTAPGLVLSDSTSGTVKTYTARAYATVTVTVTGGANATAAWTVDGASAAAPSTLTEGQTYSVTYTANEGYKFADGAATSASGTAGTEAISINIDDAVADSPTYNEDQELKIGGEGGTTHELTQTEAEYLNAMAAGKTPDEMASILAGVNEDTFKKAALLNQDITEANAGKYSFKIKKIRKSGSTVTVTASLVREGTVFGDIRGTATLYTASTPELLESNPTKQSLTFSLNAEKDQEAVASVTFTGADKFFKVVIE